MFNIVATTTSDSTMTVIIHCQNLHTTIHKVLTLIIVCVNMIDENQMVWKDLVKTPKLVVVLSKTSGSA